MPAGAAPLVKQPFAEHLFELRTRLLYCLLSLLIGVAVGYYFRETLFSLLLSPLNQPLFYTSPIGGFDFLMRTCIFFGFIFSVPVIVYQFLKFLEPALGRPLKQRIVYLLLASWTLVGIGIGFAYMVSLPAALHFLGEFSTDQVKSLISTDEYFSFLLTYLAGFAVVFQMPLIMLFMNSMSRMSTAALLKSGRFVILISFVLAAVLTPTPDPLNQCIMALPMIVLYYFSVALISYVNRKPAKASRPKGPHQPPTPRKPLAPPPLPPRGPHRRVVMG